MFKKILIANRGEIACRVMRTCREMGIASVAVYSDADIDALHVREADEAVHIGASLASESYLNIDRIVEAAKQSGAEAVHPGYGFLSENAKFVEAVEAAGLVFIGPSASAMGAMGLKDAAKVLMEEAGVPVVPGYHGDNQDAGFLAKEAKKIGYPVLIKARAGGGGKGMRVVETAGEFVAGLEGAIREGQASFGDGHVLIEKYISSPRHIEIQVFGDDHGNVVHMFERDCSLQRRHQKVIEEAPAPGMSDEMRSAMGAAAVRAAKAVSYSGAGTVEFIVDGSAGLKVDRFWFMEMNTRLQVEHPVTEMITGLDLVELQLRVAFGEELPFVQDDLAINGWAFEVRLYAEDPANGFLPSVGEITCFHMPEDIARVDCGVEELDEIATYYDPMIGKIITHGATREDALAKMICALEETYIGGVTTNTAFLSALCRHREFGAGIVDTGLIGRNIDALVAEGSPSETDVAIAAILAVEHSRQQSRHLDELSNEAKYEGWRHWGLGCAYVDMVYKEKQISCSVMRMTDGSIGVGMGDGKELLHLNLDFEDNMNADFMRVSWEGGRKVVASVRGSGFVEIISLGKAHVFEIADPLESGSGEVSNINTITAPMPGMLKAVHIKVGEKVSEGQVLVVLEAMKMEHSLVAPRGGIIETVSAKVGEQIEDGVVLVALVDGGSD